ncbi:MAG TPA: LuxR C-terminal-related transcriptional regulator [Chitinophagales bacterium]|nr:LuxR C-terminal-related transcriptional regulator [Chitinophagales bacterium]
MKQLKNAKEVSNLIQYLLLIFKAHLSSDEKLRTVSITFDTEQKTKPGQRPSRKIPVVFSKVSTPAVYKSPELLHQSLIKMADEEHPAKQETNRTHIKTMYLNEKEFNHFPNNSPIKLKPQPDAILSIREKEIIEILAEGYSHKMIASRLGISVNTVRNHFRRIHFKLRVHSNTEVLLKALQSGIVKAKSLSILMYLGFDFFNSCFDPLVVIA